MSGDIKQYLKQIRKMIHEYGWFVQGVFPTGSDRDPEFAYTIGLTEAGLPELLIAGTMRTNVLHQLVNAAAVRHVKDELVAGQTVDDIANVVFQVRECGPDAPVQQAHNYYGDPHRLTGKVRVLQLVWPDERGVYPGTFLWTDEARQPLY